MLGNSIERRRWRSGPTSESRKAATAIVREHKALALVVELPAGGDPLEAAKAHVIEHIKKDYADTVPDIKLEPMTRSPSGMALPTGGPAIGRFLFKAPGDRENKVMYVIAAISVGGKTVAVEAHTLERTASYVDEWMVHLAGSLKAK